MAATGVPIGWEVHDAGLDVMDEYGTPLPDHVLDSIRRTKVAIKGPITTPVGKGFLSVNVALRKELDLFANLRPVTMKGVRSRFDDIDLVVVRENTEDLYAGIEHMVGEDAAESIKIITRKGSERIARFAFEYARRHGRRKVTAVHKANIMKCTDGLFLRGRPARSPRRTRRSSSRTASSTTCACSWCRSPSCTTCWCCPNLYGDIVSDLCAGLNGGLGVAPGANIGDDAAVFEPVHGSAPKYAGQDKVNPTALLRSGVLLLEHLGEDEAARRMEDAIAAVIAEGKDVTYDLGGDGRHQRHGHRHRRAGAGG